MVRPSSLAVSSCCAPSPLYRCCHNLGTLAASKMKHSTRRKRYVMKAVVFHGIGDIRLEEVDDPKKEPTDAIVTLAASAICGTDLHMIRGTVTGM